MPLASTARESLNMAKAAGWGQKDFSGLSDFWCEVSDVPKARLK